MSGDRGQVQTSWFLKLRPCAHLRGESRNNSCHQLSPNLYLHTISWEWKRSVCSAVCVCVWLWVCVGAGACWRKSKTKPRRQEASTSHLHLPPPPPFHLSIVSFFATCLLVYLPSRPFGLLPSDRCVWGI